PEQLEGLARMGRKSAENVVKAVAAARRRPLARLVFGLGIRHVGKEVAELLADHFPLQGLQAATQAELEAIPGIGPRIAASVHDFFRLPQTAVLLEKLQAANLRLEEQRERPA